MELRRRALPVLLLVSALVIAAWAGCGGAETSPPSATPTPDAATPPRANTDSAPDSMAATPPLAPMALEPAFPDLTLNGLVGLAFPPDVSDQLFAVLQPGRIVSFQHDPAAQSTRLFLDIRERVNSAGSEEGLLGLAFDPGYSANGFFYVYYSAGSPRRSIVSRFSVSPGDPDRADPTSELVLLEVDQPFANHNGGQLAFGPDDNLYISLGDGGSGGDPFGNGQNAGTFLGSILRIDVSGATPATPYVIPADNPFAGSGGDPREEIWAYGLRNPWRFSFDRVTGVMWVADVGQSDREEIDIIEPGLNYGWNIMEGTRCFTPSSGQCGRTDLAPPVFEYTHDEGCSVTGGYVYRGPRLPRLHGAYLYADFCSGKVWALRHDGNRVTDQLELVNSDLRISSFAEDAQGEVYILSHDRGVFRLRE